MATTSADASKTTTQAVQQTKQTTTKQTKKAAAKPTLTPSGPAKPVITEDEVSRMIDLGLGRGVDATLASPWSMKSSFQVRHVTLGCIIGTEEGGALQAYEREISSVTTQQSTLKSSISVPQAPVSISLEGEYSRSSSSTRKAVGKRILNRTVSFRADFDDVPQGLVNNDNKNEHIEDDTDTGTASANLYAGLAGSAPVTAQARFTFEQRLAEWILERILQRWEKESFEVDEDQPQPKRPTIVGVDPIADIADYLKTASKDEKKNVYSDCVSFVRHFRITHYVNAIQLGASEYRVLSENEYYKKISTGGTFGLEAVAKFVSSESHSKKTTFKASDTKKIGKIIYDKVARGSYDEAVVGIKIMPIHTLVKLRYLHLALRRALLDYVDEQGDTTSGPYLIGCGNKPTIYWQVTSDQDRHIYDVGATTSRAAASFFYIIPNDDGVHPYEFRIGWSDGESSRQLKRTRSSLRPDTPGHTEPLFRYLDARVSITGNNSGPLHLKSELHNTHSRLTLHNRVIGDNKAPIDTRVWGYGSEEFFINCSRRRFKKDGFVAVKRADVRGRNRQMEERYITMCVPNERYHDERMFWMLFRLYPAHLRDIKEGDDEDVRSLQEEELDDEFEGFFGTVSKIPLLRLVLPQRSPSSSHDRGKSNATGKGAAGVATSTGGTQGGGAKFDVGGASLDVSGVPPSSNGLDFKHEVIPLTTLPHTTAITKTTPI